MTPERLAEIRLDIESYEKHQRYGPHELPYRTIERLECDDFPKYVRELIDAIDAQSAEIAALTAEVERYKDESDYLSERVEVLSSAGERVLEKLFQVHTQSGTTYSIPPYGTAQKMADTALNDLKQALGHKI